MEYDKFELKDIDQLMKDLEVKASSEKKRSATLYTGDEGVKMYLKKFNFSDEEIEKWLEAPYDLPNLGIKVYESPKYKEDEDK